MNKKGGGIFAGLLDFLRRVFAKNTQIEINAKKPNKNENEHTKPSKEQGKQSTEKSNAQQQKSVAQNDLNNQKTRAQNNFKEQQSDAQNKAESQQAEQSKGMDSKRLQPSSILQQSQKSPQSQQSWQSAQQEQQGTLQKQHDASQSASQNTNHTNETNLTNGDSNNLDNSQLNKNGEKNDFQERKTSAGSSSQAQNSQETKGFDGSRETENSTRGGANNQHDLNSRSESCSPKAADNENQHENSIGPQRNDIQDVDLDKLKERLHQLIGDYVNNPSQWTPSQSNLQPEPQQSNGDNKTDNAKNEIDNTTQTSRSQVNNNPDNSCNQVSKICENPNNSNIGDSSKAHDNGIGRPITNRIANELIEKLSNFAHENGAYDSNDSSSNNDAQNKNEQGYSSGDISSGNSKEYGGILPRTVFSKNHVSGNTIDIGDNNLNQISNANQSGNSNQNKNLNSNVNSKRNVGSEQNNKGLQDESCNRTDHNKGKNDAQNGDSQENGGESLSSGANASRDLNNAADNNGDSVKNDANGTEKGNETAENANTSAYNDAGGATPQNSDAQQNSSKTSLKMIDTYHMNLSKNLVPYGDLEQDEEKVNEIIVKTVVNNFFKMRFKSTRSNLNTRDGSGEKVQGYAKWDAKKIVLHKSTKEYNKMLQDKYDYEYSSGKREHIPLAIYLDLSVSMNNYIPMLLTIALQFLKNDVTVIIGANASATMQINSVSDSITRDELVSIVKDEKHTPNTKCTPLNSIDIHEYLVSKKAEKTLIFSDYDTLTSVAKLSNTDCQVYWFNTKGVRKAELNRFNFNGAIQAISNQNDIIKAIVEFTKHNYSGVRYKTQDALSHDK